MNDIGALEVCGKDMSVEEILSTVQKDAAFYGTVGGMTLSGGEPFLQKEGAVALLKACKRCGISTAVETCGYADPGVLRAAAAYVDLFLDVLFCNCCSGKTVSVSTTGTR